MPVARLLAGVEAPNAGGDAAVALVQKRESLRLLRAYNAITDKRVKQSLRDLTEAAARVTTRRG